MKARTRNIIVLILAIAIGGGFLFYVAGQNSTALKNQAVATENFIPKTVNAYALFNFNYLKEELTEELKDLDGAFLATLAANKFIANNLTFLKKEEVCAISHLSDSIGKFGILIGQLDDSLVDLQQSGFVLRKKAFVNQVYAGQYKNLFMAVFSDTSMNEKLALSRCNSYIKSDKRTDVVFTPHRLHGQVLHQSEIHPKNIVADSFKFSLAYDKNQLVIHPYFSNKGKVFNESGLRKKFKNDAARNSIHFAVFPKPFLNMVNELEKVQKLKDKLNKLGLDIPLLENAWNGEFIYSDLGQKKITNSYIIYEMDDDFNTIEVEKKTEKEISAFAIAIGVDENNQHDVFNELLNRKLIKEQGDHYVLLNVLDAEVQLHEEGDYFIFSNMPNAALIELKAVEPSNAEWNIKGKRIHATFGEQILVKY